MKSRWPSGRNLRWRKRLAAVLLALTALQGVVPALPAYAQGEGFSSGSGEGFSSTEGFSSSDSGEAFSGATDPTAVKSEDDRGFFQKAWEWIQEKLEKFAKTAAAVAYKQALSYFLKRLAVDTATQLAEGGKGKKPLYETEGWGAYLSRVGDSAAGHFIQSFAEGVGLPNLCRPKFNLKLKLSLGLLDAAHPPEEPACTFTQLADNWEQFIDNPPKLDQIIHDSFSPNQNDFGIGIGVWSSFYTKQAEEHEEQILSRLESQGLKPVVDIAGNILTPGSLIKEWTADALSPETLGDVYFTYTGEAVADAVNAFSSTLVSKMLQRLYTKGFGGGSSKPDKFSWSKLEGLRSPTADPNALRTDARQDFESFFSTNLAIGDPRLNRMDVTSLLVGDGVINQSFKTAIDRKLTVRQAIQEGLLFADGPGATFGYTRAGTQPNANEGYAHSALVILRKYRILPVGWELAAAYVGQLEQRQAYSLNDVIRAFGNPDSPFYGLVDDGWVLKAPETYCRLTGPGDKFTSVYSREETIVQRNKPADPVTGQLPSYQFERRTVSRENTCTDTRSCIVEDASGTCRAYGLCTQETPVWKFAGTQCPPQYDSCRSYEDDANRAVSYLGDTLDAGGCDANSVGCQWYCRDFNVGSGVWSCVSEAERVRKPCQQLGRCSVGGRACAQDAECPRGETCQGASCLGTDVGTGISCQIPYGAVACTVPRCGAAESFVGNSGFETESADLSAQAGRVAFAAGWSTNDVVGGGSRWQRISGVNNQVAAGNYAVRIDPDGTAAQMVAQSDPISVPAAANPPYTLTARIYSTLQFGRAYVEVVPSASGGCSTIDVDYAKGQWATVSCTTSDPLAGGSVRLVVEAVAGINPVGTVWFDEVRLERACPLQDVTVYLEGTQDADGSKLYFDRDISSCSQEESGCRALIPTGQGAVNLLYNSSFEAWPDPSSDFPPNWVRHPGDTAGDPVARETEGAAFGGNFLHYTDSEAATSDFRTAVLPLLQPGTTYQVAFFAKANTANTDWRAWLDSVDSAGTASNLELIADGLGICDAGTNPACRRESDCAAAGAGSCHSALPLTTEWQRFLFEPVEAPNAHREFRLRLGSSAASDIALDGVQIAAVAPRAEPAALAYADYISNPATYLKTPPAYLGCTGDPQTDHSACSRYSQVCRADEVGCERYTPTNGEPPLPGITTAGDQCPAACVDYSAFSQTATYFADAIPNTANPDFLYFIARTARACEARYAGCEQFTNLDEVARGGEGRGSYTYLRQCTKPDANVCRTYYTWVGSEVNGYQLKSYTLRRDVADRAGGAANGDLEEPDIAPIPQDLYLGQCVDAEDAASNPNCREFHATNGGVYYRLLRQTVACSDTCHPFRLIDSSQTVCQDSGGYWGVCGDDTDADGDIDTPLVDCLAQGGMQLVGGSDCFLQQATCLAIAGQEFEARNECIYQAVPSESISCPAAQAGCREYRGNAGGNLRTVFFDDFEDGDTLGWTAGSISSDAVTIGGHSISGMTLQTMIRAVACSNALAPCTAGSTTDCFDATTEPDTCRLFNAGQECRAQDGEAGCGFLRERITAGRNYQLTFWAKAQSGVATVDVTMAGVDCGQGGATCTLLDDQRVVTDWEEYTSPPILVSSVSPIAMLQFVVTAGGLPISVDFVALTEVQEYSYLIKNSWRTPQICDTDPTLDARRFPAPNSPQFALGCQEYATSKGQVTYLKSFERLCRDSSVGCEEFVDTKNSTSALSEQFNIGHAQAGVTVPADTLAYYVRDLSKECAASAEGCQAFGLPLQDARGQISGYQTRYLINDPERYGVTLCTEDQVGCREYVSPQVGTVYFRDPGARTCEYKQIPHRQDFGWFIAGSTSSVPDCPAITTRFGQTQPGKTCQGGDLEGQICTSDADCSFKVCRGGGTFEGARCDSNIDCGTGVCETSGGDCRTWVGQCPAEYASCTAYVDPMSDPQAGMLPNSNFEGFFRVCSHDTQTVCRLDGDCSAASGGLRFCANGTPCGGPPDCGGEACELSTCSVSKLNSWNLAGSPADHQRGEGVNRSSAVRVTAPTPAGTEVRQSLGLTGGTLYTVTASVKNSARDASIVVTTADGSKRPIFTQFDHSVAIFSNGVLAQRGDTVVLPVGGVTESAYRRFTGRFFAQESDRAVTVKITNAGTYDDVDLKPTGVYHYLADSIERSSCNGVYDPAQGCVLVNDTSDPTLKYSTSATVAGQPPSVCQPQQCLGGTRPGAGCTSDGECGAGGICRPGTCDSNLLVKVTPDRTCARWLDCISSRKQVSFRTGQVQEFCQQIATCDRLDPISGRCSSYPTEELQALTFDAGSVQLAQFFSGYAKVGFQWDADTKVDGYFPYGVMTQRKVCVAGNRGAACLEDADCHTGDERDGVCQPVLQVGANAADDLIFESCRVYPSGSAPRWTARAPVDTGDEPAKSQVVDINDPLTDTLTGSLLSQTSLAEASECHYVQGRSEFLGLYGFCVEKDPRSPYLCLNWLPVDELTGGWVGITGWRGNLRAPTYLCNESTVLET
ncbi:MAG: hypothetical protein Q7S23_02355, partial [bacterium]|nr:hypothetical protein [bacterium]